MDRISTEDIRQLSTEDLKAKVVEEKQRLTKMKFNHSVSPVENPMILRYLRRDIARLSTELTKRVNEEKVNNK